MPMTDTWKENNDQEEEKSMKKKIERISGMFQLYFKFKNRIDDINKIQELEFFNDLEDITEEQLEEIGNNIEPQFKYEITNKKKRRTRKKF